MLVLVLVLRSGLGRGWWNFLGDGPVPDASSNAPRRSTRVWAVENHYDPTKLFDKVDFYVYEWTLLGIHACSCTSFIYMVIRLVYTDAWSLFDLLLLFPSLLSFSFILLFYPSPLWDCFYHTSWPSRYQSKATHWWLTGYTAKLTISFVTIEGLPFFR